MEKSPEKNRSRTRTSEAAEAAINEGGWEMSQTDVFLGLCETMQYKIQAVAEQDAPRTSNSMLEGNEESGRNKTADDKKGLREEEKRDANFRRATDGQALRCVRAGY